MNTKHLLAASVAALVSTAGFAQYTTVDRPADSSPTTRAEVLQELHQAREQGTIVLGDTQTYETPDTSMQPDKSREEVRAELRAARAENMIVEGDTQSYLIPEDLMVSEKSRSEVMDELRQARAAGELSPQADNHGPEADTSTVPQSY